MSAFTLWAHPKRVQFKRVRPNYANGYYIKTGCLRKGFMEAAYNSKTDYYLDSSQYDRPTKGTLLLYMDHFKRGLKAYTPT